MSSPDDEPEELLAGDGVTRVVRIGQTVHRPTRPFTATIQAFLAHLHAHGFGDAPEPLGYDPQRREVLSYIPGAVPVEPLPTWATTLDVLADLARVIRRLHDAAEGWTPPPGATFGSLPRTPPRGLQPLFEVPELVSHQDYCPGNVVFRDGRPAALIDFDLARPTTRVADAVNALYWWVPLLYPVDRPPALGDADAARRIRVFADAYGMDRGQRAAIVPTAALRAVNATLTMRAAAEVDPVFRRWCPVVLDAKAVCLVAVFVQDPSAARVGNERCPSAARHPARQPQLHPTVRQCRSTIGDRDGSCLEAGGQPAARLERIARSWVSDGSLLSWAYSGESTA